LEAWRFIVLDELKRALSGKALALETRLSGVSGHTGTGRFRYAAWSDGHVAYEADLKGIAGLKANIWAHGRLLASLAVKDGKAVGKFDSRAGDAAPALAEGDLVEIRQNGDVILQGELIAERR
jgi:hypothetical protein